MADGRKPKQHQGFVIGDYALSAGFRAGLDRLLTVGRERGCAIMCSEVAWWRYHRRIVVDQLIARGERVFRLMGWDQVVRAKLTDGARLQATGQVTYPR